MRLGYSCLMELITGDYQYRAITFGPPAQRFWHSAKLRLIERLGMLPDGEPVLDAGCGSGVVSKFLSQNGMKVVGVDSNTESIRFAQSQYGSINLQFKHHELQNVSKLGPFHAIYCLEVLEHLESQTIKEVLQEFHRSATPKAKVLITVPNSHSAWPVIEWILDTFKLVPKLKGEQHLSSFSKKTLRSALTGSGWNVLEVGTFNGIAAFLSRFSGRLALRTERFEFSLRRFLPFNLIYCVAIRLP